MANAEVDPTLKWSAIPTIGVSTSQHFEGFLAKVEQAKTKVYNKTRRHMPNYMLVSSSILPILTFLRGYQAADVRSMNGPFFAGTLNGLKVYVTPNIPTGRYVLGVNYGDLSTSAAVYAPLENYM